MRVEHIVHVANRISTKTKQHGQNHAKRHETTARYITTRIGEHDVEICCAYSVSSCRALSVSS